MTESGGDVPLRQPLAMSWMSLAVACVPSSSPLPHLIFYTVIDEDQTLYERLYESLQTDASPEC